MKKMLLKGIEWYQKGLSPLNPPACRFRPTCSEYARIAIERFGAARGTYLAARRLARCHPLCRGGYDPVPDPPDSVIRRDENH